MKRFSLYSGTFLLALSTLVLEISLARLLSVASWYYLAFFTISTAMLGSTAGAIYVFLRPVPPEGDAIAGRLSRFTIGYAALVPVTLITLCVLPLDFNLLKTQIVMNVLTLFIATLATAVPYFFAGVALTTVLTQSGLPVGKIYASDLIGAALGCLFVLFALEWFSVMTLILVCSLLGFAAAALFTGAAVLRKSSPAYALLLAACLVTLLNGLEPFGISGIRPYFVKGNVESTDQVIYEKWNSFSRVHVGRQYIAGPQFWGGSPNAPKEDAIHQHAMNIDGAAGTYIRRFLSLKDIEHLRYDVTNLAYYLRPAGGACVIGVGGGRDIQSALLFGQSRILGIELNPIFTNLHQTLFKDFSGIANRPGIELVTDEGRSYLSRSTESFAIVQLSLIDTWASTGAGAFSLSENALYTTEAWQLFLRRLKSDGILTVSRWHSPEDLGETGRVVSLAMSALIAEGNREPRKNICLISYANIATVLIKRTPFTAEEVARLRTLCRDLAFVPVIMPDATIENPVLRTIASAVTQEELRSVGGRGTFDYTPPSDNNPYFFNMLRFSTIFTLFSDRSILHEQGVVRGNLVAIFVLAMLVVCLLVAALGAVVLPLALTRRGVLRRIRNRRAFIAGAVYFSLIGCGFMLVEISLMQRLTMFLGHPVYSLGIILFSLILSTGIGSYSSERVSLRKTTAIAVVPVAIAGCVMVLSILLPALFSAFISSPLLVRAALSVGLIGPLGFLMGFCFPMGMRLVQAIRHDAEVTPWYWALNGIFGVLSSSLAIMISIYTGISTNFMIAVVLYLLLIPCMRILHAARNS